MHQKIPGTEQAQHITDETERQDGAKPIEKYLQALCESDAFFNAAQSETERLQGDDRAFALSALAKSLARAGRFDEAEKTARQLSESMRAIVLLKRAAIMAESGAAADKVDAAFQEAQLEVARLNGTAQLEVLETLAISLAQAGEFGLAEKYAHRLAQLVGQSPRRDRVFYELAISLARAGIFGTAEECA